MSAVSTNVIPRSSARRMTATASSPSTVPPKVFPPRPTGETLNPEEPSLRSSTWGQHISHPLSGETATIPSPGAPPFAALDGRIVALGAVFTQSHPRVRFSKPKPPAIGAHSHLLRE